jgi:hypothetical protein
LDQAGDAVAEVEHFAHHGVGEAFDFGHAVADFADDADVLTGDAGLHLGDLRFDVLQQGAHVGDGLGEGLGSLKRGDEGDWKRG